MSEELKPCPFCGSDAVTLVTEGHPVHALRAYCAKCGGLGAGSTARTGSGIIGPDAGYEAIAAWNSRPIEGKLQYRIDKLETENAKLRDEALELEADLAFEAEGNAYADTFIGELRDRIDKLEWLREVEKAYSTTSEWHPDRRKRDKEANRRRGDARAAMRRMWWNAREAVES